MSNNKKESGYDGLKRRKRFEEEDKAASKRLKSFLVPKPQENEEIESAEMSQFPASQIHVNINECENSFVSNDQSIAENAVLNIDAETPELSNETSTLEESVEDVPNNELEKILKHKDIGYLMINSDANKFIVSDGVRLEIVKRGGTFLQNKTGPFVKVNGRSMNETWFLRAIGAKGTFVNRSWLIYSPLKEACYCIVCILFSNSDSQSSLVSGKGFQNWRDKQRIQNHELTDDHRKCQTDWAMMEVNLRMNKGMIDSELQTHIDREKTKWRNVLLRVFEIIKFLASQNLAFRGHTESLFNMNENPGNFLALIKLLGKFDPVTRQHIEYLQENPHATSYLSSAIQNEIISLMATAVRERILCKIKHSKYFGLLFDSTPDAVSVKIYHNVSLKTFAKINCHVFFRVIMSKCLML